MGMFRKLRADEIECRIGQVAKSGSISLLLYKDARVDQRLLDETVGEFRWRKSYVRDSKGALFCVVGIKSEDGEWGEWIDKSDVGTESNMEAIKGEASDAFKRACVNWGIGRELYTAPQIWIKPTDFTPGGNSTYDRFSVTDITYDGDNISRLVIKNNSTNKKVFTWGTGQAEAVPEDETEALKKKTVPATKINALTKRCATDKVDVDKLCKLYGVKSLEELNEGQFSDIVNTWSAEILPKCKQ